MGKLRAERLQFLAPLGRHLHVQLRRTGRMAEFIVFQAGHDRIFAAQNTRAGRDVAGNAVRR